MKKTLLFFFFSISILYINAQLKSPENLSTGKNKSTGKKLLKKGAVEASINYLEAAEAKKQGNKSLVKILAPAELEARNYAAAEHYFSLLVEKDKKHKKPELLYKKAIALQQQQKYSEALAVFKQFREIATNDKYSELVKAAKKAMEGCNFGLTQTDTSIKKEFKVLHLENVINTALDEQSVAFLNRKDLLFSQWDNSIKTISKKQFSFANNATLQLAESAGKVWQAKGIFSGLAENSENLHLATPSFSDDGKTLYFSVCSEALPLKLRCDIYKSDLVNNTWQKATKLNSSINLPTADNLWPSVGKAPGGEEALFFSSNRNANKGYDIFYAVRNSDGTFQRAKALGAPINTKDDEIAPFYDYETNLLYFSSNKMGGLGGYDIFSAQRLVIGDFLDPKNLGMPVNSGADDYGFSYFDRKNTGFLISNRNSVTNSNCTTCNDDIWAIETFKIYPAVKGEIVRWQNDTKQTVNDATISLLNTTNGTQAGYTQATDGKFFFDLETETDYKLVVKREGVADLERTISTIGLQQNDTFTFNFVLDSVKDYTGEKLATVFWDFDKFQLTASAPDSLQKVIDFYTKFPQYSIEVGSHTDSKGDEKYNLKLSERRGAAVVKFLLSKQIPATNLANKPYGESRPIAPNTLPDGKDSEEGRALNRRTEFNVLGVQQKK
ncbi:MAG TPA: OmpA family protein [Chitinophagales bacterium]|nr:OmpA family protein [Chitinophagales bacterium]HRP38504.1 OmpA family protein [Chitinophagales bacterium]